MLGWIIIVFTIVFGFLNLDSEKDFEYKTGKFMKITGIILGFIAALLKILLKKYL